LFELSLDKMLELTYGTDHKVVYKKPKDNRYKGEAPLPDSNATPEISGANSPQGRDQSPQGAGHPPQSGDHPLQEGDHPLQGGDVHSSTHNGVHNGLLHPNGNLSLDKFTEEEGATSSRSAAEKSNDFLPKFETPAETLNSSAHEAHQPPLLGAAATASIYEKLPPAAQTLARRFIEYAKGLGHDVPLDVAARIVNRSPVTPLSETGLRSWITSDNRKAGLAGVMGGRHYKALIADYDELRWCLFSWPGHREKVIADYERKKQEPKLNGAFITKFEENDPPGPEWLAKLLKQDADELNGLREEQQRENAREFFASLSTQQKNAFDREMARGAQQNGALILRGTTQWDELRVQLLNDADVRKRLAQSASSAAASAQPEPAPSELEEQEAFAPPPRAARHMLTTYLPKFLPRLKSRDLETEDLESECKKIAGLSNDEKRWLADRVLEAWENLQKEKVA
jgi:hypothetical protein